MRNNFYVSPFIRKLINEIMKAYPEEYINGEHVINTAIVKLCIENLGFENFTLSTSAFMSLSEVELKEIAQVSRDTIDAGVFCERCLTYKPCLCNRALRRGLNDNER